MTNTELSVDAAHQWSGGPTCLLTDSVLNAAIAFALAASVLAAAHQGENLTENVLENPATLLSDLEYPSNFIDFAHPDD
jgi:hypothetical protein